jgi:alpha-tubulin suppressor-like RCC1 family protein
MVPTVVPTLRGLKILDVAAGARHTVAVSSDGDVYTWGDNTQHQLGENSIIW